MDNQKYFQVYKSSAGSGKTYTLVKKYILLVLKSPSKFRQVLAITFTNKAANEMKERIVRQLYKMGYEDCEKDIMSKELSQELSLDSDHLQDFFKKIQKKSVPNLILDLGHLKNSQIYLEIL